MFMFVRLLNACFFKILAAAATQDDAPGGVVAWVSFGRVGSTTMRKVLQHRAELKGFRKYDGPDGLCHIKPINWSSTQEVQCGDVEPGYVVQTEYGFCQRLKGARPCRYMTLLRDPLNTIVSEYNWFCKACKEGGKQCVSRDKQNMRKRFLQEHPRSTPQLTCPNMLITDYAKHYRNQYTMQFSGKKIFCSQSGESPGSIDFRDCSETLTEDDYQAALGVLTRRDVLVLLLETLWVGATGVSPAGITKLANFLPDPDLIGRAEVHRNGHNKSYVPTQGEMDELKRILSFDIRLYEEMQRRDVMTQDNQPSGAESVGGANAEDGRTSSTMTPSQDNQDSAVELFDSTNGEEMLRRDEPTQVNQPPADAEDGRAHTRRKPYHDHHKSMAEIFGGTNVEEDMPRRDDMTPVDQPDAAKPAGARGRVAGQYVNISTGETFVMGGGADLGSTTPPSTTPHADPQGPHLETPMHRSTTPPSTTQALPFSVTADSLEPLEEIESMDKFEESVLTTQHVSSRRRGYKWLRDHSRHERDGIRRRRRHFRHSH